MIVVSDASPILNLSVVGKLDLLRELYTEVVIPSAVHRELVRNQIDIERAWIRIVATQNQEEVGDLCRELDLGESEAIVLAGELGADILLIDEKHGRRIATSRGLEVTGLLGVLAEAKARGVIPECRPVLEEMIRKAGFWIGDDLRLRYLRELGEIG